MHASSVRPRGAAQRVRLSRLVMNSIRIESRNWRRAHPRAARLVIIAAIVLAAGVIARISMEPLARHFTARGLAKMKRFHGEFSDVSFSLFALTYTIEDLKITERDAAPGDPPLLFAKEVRARIQWRNLLHGTVIGFARVEGVKAGVVLRSGGDAKTDQALEVAAAPPRPWQVDDAIETLIPFQLERVEVRASEVLIVDARKPERPELWFSEVEAAVENFTTRRALDEGKPLTIAGQCRFQHSGRCRLFLVADPLAERPTFRGEAELRDLQLNDVHSYVVAATDGLTIPDGQLDIFVSFDCVNGRLSGGLKPFLKRATIEPADDGLGTRIRAALADAGLSIFSDRVPSREAAAAIIPIAGEITNPDVEAWSTIVSLLQNAFVEGLATGFSGLPTETPPELPAETAKKENG